MRLPLRGLVCALVLWVFGLLGVVGFRRRSHGCSGGGSRRGSLPFFQRSVYELFVIAFDVIDQAAEGGLHLHFAAFRFGIQHNRVDALAGEGSSDVEGGGQIFVVNAADSVLPRVAESVFHGRPQGGTGNRVVLFVRFGERRRGGQ